MTTQPHSSSPGEPPSGPPPAGEPPTGSPATGAPADVPPDGQRTGWWTTLPLSRPKEPRVIAGVCTGLGRATGVDPLLFRILIAVLAFFGGVGILLYAVAWLVIPEDGDNVSPLEAVFGRGRASLRPIWTFLLIAVAIIAGLATLGTGPQLLLLIALAVLGAVVLVRSTNRSAGDAAIGSGPPMAPPPGLGDTAGSGGAAAGSGGAAATAGAVPTAAPSPATAGSGFPGGGGDPLVKGYGADVPATFAATAPTGGDQTTERLPSGDPSATGTEADTTSEPSTASGTGGQEQSAASTTEASRSPQPTLENGLSAQGPPATAPTALSATGVPRPADATAESYTAPYAPYGPYATSAPEPPEPPAVASPAPPRRPKERSILGRVTFSAAVLAVGLLTLLDALIPGRIAAGAYFAIPLAVIGVGLLIGTVRGRARWLAWIGVPLALMLGMASVAIDDDGPRHQRDRIGGMDRFGQAVNWRPTTAGAIAGSYDTEVGTATLDLRKVDFASSEPITTELTGEVGSIRVLLPPRVDVQLTTEVEFGRLTTFGQTVDGASLNRTLVDYGQGGPGGGQLELTVKMESGTAEVTREAA